MPSDFEKLFVPPHTAYTHTATPPDSPDTSAAMGAWILATFFAVVAAVIAYGVSPVPFLVLAGSFALLSIGKAIGNLNTNALRRHDKSLQRIDQTLEAIETKVTELECR